MPRVRLHVWKLISRALPLGATVNRRIQTADPMCHLCSQLEETSEHHAFKCPFARMCHFQGPIALKTEDLTGTIVDMVLLIGSQVDDAQWTHFMNSIWSIWRCRNDGTYGGKKPDLSQFVGYFRSISWESQLRETTNRSQKNQQTIQIRELVTPRSCVCYTDGAWMDRWNGGIGIAIFSKEELVIYRSARALGCSPITIEAIALREAISLVLSRGIHECTFLSDCLLLVKAVNSTTPPSNVDWRAFSVIMQVWNLFKHNPDFDCYHIDRSQNALADSLAKKGRTEGWDVSGFTFPLFA